MHRFQSDLRISTVAETRKWTQRFYEIPKDVGRTNVGHITSMRPTTSQECQQKPHICSWIIHQETPDIVCATYEKIITIWWAMSTWNYVFFLFNPWRWPQGLHIGIEYNVLNIETIHTQSGSSNAGHGTSAINLCYIHVPLNVDDSDSGEGGPQRPMV